MTGLCKLAEPSSNSNAITPLPKMNQIILFLNIVASGVVIYIFYSLIVMARINDGIFGTLVKPKKWVWPVLLISLAWLLSNFVG